MDVFLILILLVVVPPAASASHFKGSMIANLTQQHSYICSKGAHVEPHHIESNYLHIFA